MKLKMPLARGGTRNRCFIERLLFSAVWILVLMTFWMRPQCSERIHVGCVSILIMVILLLYFRTALPPSGKSVPLVGKIMIAHVSIKFKNA